MRYPIFSETPIWGNISTRVLCGLGLRGSEWEGDGDGSVGQDA